MKKVLLVFCLVILGVGLFGSVQASADTVNLNDQCLEMVDYISSHKGELEDVFNQNLKEDEELNISSIEGYSLIYILDEEDYGVYIDFNGNHGYILITFDSVIYELKATGDLDYLKDVSLAYYYSADGFLYQTENGYERYGINERTGVIGAGQFGSGDGNIYDLSAYVSDKYPNYTFVEEVAPLAEDYRATLNQIDISYFVKMYSYDGGYTYGKFDYTAESNCAFIAIYNVTNSWQQQNILPMIDPSTVTVDFEETVRNDGNYAKYGNQAHGVGITEYWTMNPYGIQKIPEVYNRVRTYAVVNFDYTPDSAGITFNELCQTVKYVAHTYHHQEFDYTVTSSFYDVMSQLENKRAVLMTVDNSTTFGNHAMCLVGYSMYNYAVQVGSLVFNYKAYFYLVDSGRGLYYFDPSSATQCNFVYYKN